MIREIVIENFKSIRKIRLSLGRVNVFIGENGCGKSNLLEAIAFVGADCAGSLSHEFLGLRGVRTPDPEMLAPAFGAREDEPIRVAVEWEGRTTRYNFRLLQTGGAERRWRRTAPRALGIDLSKAPDSVRADEEALDRWMVERHSELLEQERLRELPLARYLIYTPENSALRTYQTETQVLPLGVKGEGLFAHLRQLELRHPAVLDTLNEQLALIDWFGGFEVPKDLAPYERSLRMRDRYLTSGQLFDQRSANEGFLYLLFYFTLLCSPEAPRFFAIDNVDASLNPKLCRELVRRFVALAAANDRQALLTTHNPAALDGLDLSDDQQRLFVVYRGSEGDTRARRIKAPEPVPGERPLRLSEAFMGGYLGGLPENF